MHESAAERPIAMTDSSERRSSVSNGGFDETLDRCANCGDHLPRDEWCPTATYTGDDGRLVVRSFCDQACRREWNDDSDTG